MRLPQLISRKLSYKLHVTRRGQDEKCRTCIGKSPISFEIGVILIDDFGRMKQNGDMIRGQYDRIYCICARGTRISVILTDVESTQWAVWNGL